MDSKSNIHRLALPIGRIWRIPHLKAFLPEIEKLVLPYFGASYDAVGGWGRKPAAWRARKLAARKGVPYLALEDGFLRSYAAGVEGAPPMALVMDYSGIYYDSTAPSDLEDLIEAGDFDAATLERARTAIDWIRTEKLSKYNKDLLPYDGPEIGRLVIGQTVGDASVIYSGASEGVFERMIDDAVSAHDASRVAVKLHPDTLKGKKGAYLRDLTDKYGVTLIDQKYNPWDIFAKTQEVATISSQMGFEAMMAGKPVQCYGLPFYAGWGLTQDHLSCLRRTQKRSIEAVFAAAYIHYSRYIDPYTGQASTLEETIGILSDLVRREKRTSMSSVAVGFSLWRRSFAPHFIGKKLSYAETVKRKPDPACRVVIWSSHVDKLRRTKRIAADMPVTFMEDGFVRSRGLGAKLARPWSLVLDDNGIYYNPQTESDLETILQTAAMPEGLLQRARHLQDMLVKKGVSKYNTGNDDRPVIPADAKRVILVPGQVEDDASIQTGTVDVKTNADLLRTVREENPDAYILYKPHPDVECGKRKGKVPKDLAEIYSDDIVEKCGITLLWDIVDEVHTMTSLSGFEALLRGKRVSCYGLPFYAGWGLTQDRHAHPRRTRQLTLDALVAGTLLLYPLYYDWTTRQPCNAETVIRRLAAS